jgi:hypothetical protein
MLKDTEIYNLTDICTAAIATGWCAAWRRKQLESGDSVAHLCPPLLRALFFFQTESSARCVLQLPVLEHQCRTRLVPVVVLGY